MSRYVTVYGAPRGPRQWKLSVPEVIRTAACPRCKAAKGEWCRKVNGDERISQHRQRWVVAREVAGL